MIPGFWGWKFWQVFFGGEGVACFKKEFFWSQLACLAGRRIKRSSSGEGPRQARLQIANYVIPFLIG